VVNLGGIDQPCHILGREPGENARGFHGVEWVYHVVPAGCDFGVNVPETAVRPAATVRPGRAAMDRDAGRAGEWC